MSVGPQNQHMLRLFGVHVRQAFGHVAYHVGSSLTEKRGWRDVDVRLILPDDEFAIYFGDPLEPGWAGGPKVNMWNLAWTALGRQMTGLPIDFQIQFETEANGDGPDVQGPRSALIFASTEQFRAGFHDQWTVSA